MWLVAWPSVSLTHSDLIVQISYATKGALAPFFFACPVYALNVGDEPHPH